MFEAATGLFWYTDQYGFRHDTTENHKGWGCAVGDHLCQEGFCNECALWLKLRRMAEAEENEKPLDF